jgi:HD-GYP domain-containing protein (c-di-GMP phosphodiesterase class II)
MGTAAKPGRAPGQRLLPLVLYFEEDDECRKLVVGPPRYQRLPFSKVQAQLHEAECIVLTSSEKLVELYYSDLRAPNVRVLALTTNRFKDPRLDGMVYAYLPPGTPLNLIERMLDNAIDHINLVSTRREINDRLADATREIHELNQIGAALSAEHDTDKLLEMILTKSRQITQSDAGSLYLVEPTGHGQSKRLRFKLAQNDTFDVPFVETTMEIDVRSIAGYVALTGESVSIEDAYHPPAEMPYTFNRKFDKDSGYRTKSLLAVPMRNPKGEIVGVVQLINSKRDPRASLSSMAAVVTQVVPFNFRQRELVTSLASQAAVAYENSQLYAAIRRLFEGFVRASVSAIEARDPTTSGHSFRVANLTVALAEAVDRAAAGPYRNVRFSRDEMREIRYASLLHDFGKVGVREEVLVKAKKLYPAQLEVIRQRFQYVKRSMESESLRRRLNAVLQNGAAAAGKVQLASDAELKARWEVMDAYFAAIEQANEPTVLVDDSHLARLLDIASRHFLDLDGSEHPLLTDDEVRLLSIRQGSLDDAERRQIESHVVHSYQFLKQIPWTQELRNVPEIARSHHEKLNGSGYPLKLSAPEIPLQTRIMTISDIFDALAAGDRPYKKAVSAERALEILRQAVQDGELDPALYALFLEAKVYERWKVEPFPY